MSLTVSVININNIIFYRDRYPERESNRKPPAYVGPIRHHYTRVIVINASDIIIL